MPLGFFADALNSGRLPQPAEGASQHIRRGGQLEIAGALLPAQVVVQQTQFIGVFAGQAIGNVEFLSGDSQPKIADAGEPTDEVFAEGVSLSSPEPDAGH